jgi:hypothetical protein
MMTATTTDNVEPIQLPHALMTVVHSYAKPLCSADREAYLAAVYEQLRAVPAERLGLGTVAQACRTAKRAVLRPVDTTESNWWPG